MDHRDKLSHIFELQNAFDSALSEKRGLGHITRQEWMQKEILAILSELAELSGRGPVQVVEEESDAHERGGPPRKSSSIYCISSRACA